MKRGGHKTPLINQLRINDMTLEEKIKAFPVICYTRCVGWFTPTKNFNPGKAAEWNARKKFDLPDICKE